MDRRKFLKYQALGVFWVSTAGVASLTPEDSLAKPVPDIAVAKGAVVDATRAAVELLGGMKQFVKPGDKVVIKPNMSFASSPRYGSNTHPKVVRELVVMCKEAGASKISVLDHTLAPPDMCLKRSGIKRACDAIEKGIVRSANDYELYQDVPVKDGVTMTKTKILKEVVEADVLIAAPAAKSHSSTGVSLSMKGMMGLIWDRRSMHWQGLDEGIVDICTVLKADLTVIDGSKVLSTNGPRGPGKVLKGDTIIASKDMVAADAYTVTQFEWWGSKKEPGEIAHIQEAHNRELGRMDLENLTIQTVKV
jgi:uncharacterized protein (DUF362 family)